MKHSLQKFWFGKSLDLLEEERIAKINSVPGSGLDKKTYIVCHGLTKPDDYFRVNLNTFELRVHSFKEYVLK